MIDKLEYVSYNIAVLAAKKGYDGLSHAFYFGKGYEQEFEYNLNQKQELVSKVIRDDTAPIFAAPTYDALCYWLEHTHNISVNIYDGVINTWQVRSMVDVDESQAPTSVWKFAKVLAPDELLKYDSFDEARVVGFETALNFIADNPYKESSWSKILKIFKWKKN